MWVFGAGKSSTKTERNLGGENKSGKWDRTKNEEQTHVIMDTEREITRMNLDAEIYTHERNTKRGERESKPESSFVLGLPTKTNSDPVAPSSSPPMSA